MKDRALAHVEKVVWVREIPGADNIELIGILGWECIAKKGEFKVGDKCVYIEIDSKVPNTNPIFDFLEKKDWKVKTMKLSKFGVTSQGLAMPVAQFNDRTVENAVIGTDLTKHLGITYSDPADQLRKVGMNKADKKRSRVASMVARHPKLFARPFAKKMLGNSVGRAILLLFFGRKPIGSSKAFPTGFPYVHKTDEERIENIPWRLTQNPVKTWVATEKLDGTSSTYILEHKGKRKFEFYVSSRNVRQLNEDQACFHEKNIYWDNAKKYRIEEKLKEYLEAHPDLRYVCVQGESVGSVQGNPLKLKEDDLYIFNFITSKDGRFDSTYGKSIVEKMGMKWVPILGLVTLPDNMDDMKALAEGASRVNPAVLREGIVYRSLDGKESFKNVSKAYLLKHNL